MGDPFGIGKWCGGYDTPLRVVSQPDSCAFRVIGERRDDVGSFGPGGADDTGDGVALVLVQVRTDGDEGQDGQALLFLGEGARVRAHDAARLAITRDSSVSSLSSCSCSSVRA